MSKHHLKLSLLLLLLGAATACNGPAGSSGGEPVTNDDGIVIAKPIEEENPQAAEVFKLTNEYRVQNGQAQVKYNAQLTVAAQDYAERMANEGFFNHYDPQGGGPGERITAAGYDWATYGENIAYGYSTPALVMQGWIGSSGHRANMVRSDVTELGVGYAKSSGGTGYWVQVFGRQ